MGKGIKALFYLAFVVLALLNACKPDTGTSSQPVSEATFKVPKFERDSAYSFIEKQLSFGPRVPNTEGHEATKNWLVDQFNRYGANVIQQDFTATAYTETVLSGTNIIARFYPERTNRIILAAHWDTRHIADKDPVEANQSSPIPGADDGASGVAVLLEIARQLQQQALDNLGVDLILFDAEDHGEAGGENINSWCLGAQYWSRNPHVPAYRAKYGVLLDMVGAKDARFPQEAYSRQYAPRVVEKVWKLAKNLGYGNYFVPENVSGITDDHLFVNTIAKIPMIDIINLPQGSKTGFGHYWHTQQDDLSIIDKRTLRAVGQVMLQLLYREDAGKL